MLLVYTREAANSYTGCINVQKPVVVGLGRIRVIDSILLVLRHTGIIMGRKLVKALNWDQAH